MTHYLNITTLNGETISGGKNYAWTSSSGVVLDLDSESYVVLRDGIDGFSGATPEYYAEYAPNQARQVLRRTAYSSREFGFDVLIRGNDHEDIMRKRRHLLSAFAPGADGILQKSIPGVGVVEIAAQVARGYPDIRDGLPPGAQAKYQRVSIRLVAHDPYWYGPLLRSVAANGIVTVENTGDASTTPCRIKLAAESCTNLSTQQTMAARSGQTVAGAEVSIQDTGVEASIDGTNCLGRFRYDSQFFHLRPGTNLISGAEWVEFRPRWGGV